MTSSLFEQYKAALRRGHLAALAGELDAALGAYDEAGRLVPDRPLPLASRGTVLHRLDRWPEAAAAFDQALQLAPDDEAALRARATARAERGLRSGAATDFERLAFVLDVAGKSWEAADAARQAADLEPSASRLALADRLGAAAAHRADLVTGGASVRGSSAAVAPEGEATLVEGAVVEPAEAEPADAEPADADPAAAAPRAEAAAETEGEDGLQAAWAAMAERATLPPDEGELRSDEVPAIADAPESELQAPESEPREPEPGPRDRLDGYDALEALRAGIEAEAADAATEPNAASENGAEPADGDPAVAARAAAEPAAAEPAAGDAAADGDQAWPGIDLPSPPPPPVDASLDPEALLAEAALVLESGEVEAARDLMLTAIRIHRDAGRIVPALEVCLNLLSIAPGDPRVHLALANLQLDSGWTPVATEKLDLLVRLTSLTGDTQAAADVHGLASERLRDDLATHVTGG